MRPLTRAPLVCTARWRSVYFQNFAVSCAWLTGLSRGEMSREMQGTAGLWRFKPPMRPPTGGYNRPDTFRLTHERRMASSRTGHCKRHPRGDQLCSSLMTHILATLAPQMHVAVHYDSTL